MFKSVVYNGLQYNGNNLGTTFFPLLLELGGGFLFKLLRNVHQKTSKKRAELLRQSDSNFCYILVPSMPPANFIPISRSGDFKMSASWGPVPDGFVHGILLGYHVYYTKIQQTGRPVTTQIDKKIFGPYEHNTTILLLDNFAIYNLEIAAFTIKGDGARSQIKDGCK